jgi:UDP-N-acetylglucosamine:LPS N-acetylglucosamine transferase
VGAEGGMEASLVRRTDIAYQAIPAAGVHGVGARQLPGNVKSLAQGVLRARQVIRAFRPDVLFFTGGYVGIPVALAGRRLPKVVFVPDIEPALALRLISRMAEVITVTTEASRAYYGGEKRVVVSGYPTRQRMQEITREQACINMNLACERPVLLVFGGSRGARSINEALWKALPELLGKSQIVHITGELDWPRVEEVRKELVPPLSRDYHVFPYLHEEMVSAFAAADLVVSRAGAAVLGEYPLFGLPAVLVPYPYAWRYQKVNAAFLEERGAAVQIADDRLAQELMGTVERLLEDREQLSAMGAAARSLATPQAAQTIAVEITHLVEAKGEVHG